jgi:hypothetical protein
VNVFPEFHGGVWPYLLLVARTRALAAPVVRKELECATAWAEATSFVGFVRGGTLTFLLALILAMGVAAPALAAGRRGTRTAPAAGSW